MMPARLLIGIAVLMSCSPLIAQQHGDTIFYASLNRSIHLGQYDGSVTVKELKTRGDFGVGSLEKLSGELVMLDGTVYTIPSTGKASIAPESGGVPFASVKFFKADKSVTVQRPLTLQELEAYIDSLRERNSFAAIRITGEFSSLKFRSYVEQKKPYKPVDEVPVREFEGIGTATLVGFYTPEAAEVLNSPRYHFHVIDRSKSTGGHLLKCTSTNIKIEIDYASALVVNLPAPEQTSHLDLDQSIKKDE